MATLHITIDGTAYITTDDDQEAASLLRMAGHDPAHRDLFLVDERGVETHVDDDQILDLYDGQRLRTRERVHFTIDGTAYSSYDDDQTASALLQRAGRAPTEYDLTREGADHGGVEHFADDQLVTINDGDRFASVPQRREHTIIVNTRPHRWTEPQITYTQVVELAYPGQPVGEQEDVTVRYTYRRGHGSGTLTVGHHIKVEEGMAFDVHRTTRS